MKIKLQKKKNPQKRTEEKYYANPVNESLIQDAITELAKNRTVLVVAHHLKTIQKADQILVFQKGNLLEKGKHGELLEKDGYYTKLWKAQYEV